MKTIIQIRNLTKVINKQCIFKQINLDIYENEILVVMGNSGAGKSTLLNILCQMDNDYEGEVKYDNSIFDEIKIPFPMVFQESESLLPWLSVEENLKVIHQNIDEKVLDDVLEKVELKEHRYKKPRALSGGMKQRVGIARALLCKSKILFMDEPFASLDMELREKMQALVLKIQKEQQLSVVFVTHDEREAAVMSTRIFRID